MGLSQAGAPSRRACVVSVSEKPERHFDCASPAFSGFTWGGGAGAKSYHSLSSRARFRQSHGPCSQRLPALHATHSSISVISLLTTLRHISRRQESGRLRQKSEASSSQPQRRAWSQSFDSLQLARVPSHAATPKLNTARNKVPELIFLPPQPP
jgi:hypothetical protein